MEVAVFVHGKQIAEGTFGDSEERVLDGMEFVLDVLIRGVEVAEGAKHDPLLFC